MRSLSFMERLLLLWDEFDDWLGAGRHLVVMNLTGPVGWLRRHRHGSAP